FFSALDQVILLAIAQVDEAASAPPTAFLQPALCFFCVCCAGFAFGVVFCSLLFCLSLVVVVVFVACRVGVVCACSLFVVVVVFVVVVGLVVSFVGWCWYLVSC
ncbi:unnamed protein product, partial [Polarella glacialis]